MSPRIARLQLLVWVFIYGGLLVATLGFAVQRGGDGWGWGLCAAGCALVLAGAVMIVARSRMRDEPGA